MKDWGVHTDLSEVVGRVAFLRYHGYHGYRRYETGQTVRDRFGPKRLFFNAMMTILGYLQGTTAINPLIQ